jgi:hypothetical protein
MPKKLIDTLLKECPNNTDISRWGLVQVQKIHRETLINSYIDKVNGVLITSTLIIVTIEIRNRYQHKNNVA